MGFIKGMCLEFIGQVCVSGCVCGCVSVHACKSGVITLVNVFQDRLLASPGVHMLWHCRSKRWKSVEHRGDRWTRWHILYVREKSGKQTGRHLAADQAPSETEAEVGAYAFVCHWRHSVATTMTTSPVSAFMRLCLLLVGRFFLQPGLGNKEIKEIKYLGLEY